MFPHRPSAPSMRAASITRLWNAYRNIWNTPQQAPRTPAPPPLLEPKRALFHPQRSFASQLRRTSAKTAWGKAVRQARETEEDEGLPLRPSHLPTEQRVPANSPEERLIQAEKVRKKGVREQHAEVAQTRPASASSPSQPAAALQDSQILKRVALRQRANLMRIVKMQLSQQASIRSRARL